MNDKKNIRTDERGPASEEVKQDRAQTVNVGCTRKLGCWALGLFGCDVTRCSKCLQRSCEVAVLIEPFCETKIAHHRFANFIEQNVSRLKIAMEYPFAMSVGDGARDLGYQSHTFTRVGAKCRCRSTKAPALRVFHAEKRQAFLTFADLVNGKNVWVIETRDRFGFAPKTNQRLVGIRLMSENAFHRDDPAGVLLARAINHSHPASPNFLQDFVMT